MSSERSVGIGAVFNRHLWFIRVKPPNAETLVILNIPRENFRPVVLMEFLGCISSSHTQERVDPYTQGQRGTKA